MIKKDDSIWNRPFCLLCGFRTVEGDGPYGECENSFYGCFLFCVFAAYHVQLPEAADTVPIVEVANRSGFGVVGEGYLCIHGIFRQVRVVGAVHGVVIEPLVGNDDVGSICCIVFSAAEYSVVYGFV